MSNQNFFVSGSKFLEFFVGRTRGCRLSTCFPIVDISILSRNIRDQSLILFEIAPNFELFLPPKVLGCGPPKVVAKLSYLPRGTSPENVS